MSKYMYVSKTCSIPQNSISQYSKSLKPQMLDTVEDVNKIMIHLKSEIVLFLTPEDHSIIELINKIAVKPSIKVISSYYSVCKSLDRKVASLIFVDKISENIPILWDTVVCSYSNMLILRRLNLNSVDFQLEDFPSSSISQINFITDEENLYTQAILKTIPNNQSVKEAKIRIAYLKKEAKRIVKTSKGIVRKRIKIDLIDSDTSSEVSISKSIGDYMVTTGYLSQEGLDSLISLDSAREIELMALENNIISSEDLVDIIRSFYSLEAVGRSYLKSLDFSYVKVSDSLAKKGVVEAYALNDPSHQKTIILMSYTDKDMLLPEVTATLDYHKVLYTIPSYIKGLIMDGQKQGIN